MSGQVPAWKFWHPLSLWGVLLIFLAAQLFAIAVVVALREGLGLPVPQWVAGGAGGLLGVLGVQALARRRRPGA
jgi:hypothetical protein